MMGAGTSRAEVMEPLTFLFGGKAEFTIKNVDSGNSYKYKVSCNPKNEKMYFVSVDSEYAGVLIDDGVGIKYCQGKKGHYSVDATPIKGIMYVLRHGNTPLKAPMSMTHHGRCSFCGKALNDPESVVRGFGPVCWKKVQHR